MADHHRPFGGDRFGRAAEAAARFFGTPQYIVAQTLAVAVWIVLNSIALVRHWDPYPFILLNLAFSTQAAYAAPLILLAGNRAAARDRVTLEHAAHEADVEEQQNEELLRGNRQILEQVRALEERILGLEQRLLSRLDAPSR